jgi:hypothetical protein
MSPLHLILQVFALVCGLVAAFWRPSPPPMHFGWLGFSFFIASLIF